MSDNPSIRYNVRRVVGTGSDIPTYIPGAIKGLSAEDEHELEAGRRGENKTENQRMVDLLRKREYHKQELSSAKDLIRIAKEKTASFNLAGHLLDDMDFEKEALKIPGGKLLGGLFGKMKGGGGKVLGGLKNLVPGKARVPLPPKSSGWGAVDAAAGKVPKPKPAPTPAASPAAAAPKPSAPAPPQKEMLDVPKSDYRYGLGKGDVAPPKVKTVTDAPGAAPGGAGSPGSAPGGIGSPGAADTLPPGTVRHGTDVSGVTGGKPGKGMSQADVDSAVSKQIKDYDTKRQALESMTDVEALEAQAKLTGQDPGWLKKFLASNKGQIAAQMGLAMFPYHMIPGLDNPDSTLAQMAPMAAFMVGPGAISKYVGAGAARGQLGKAMAAGSWAPKTASRKYQFEVTAVTTPGVIRNG